MCPVRSVTYVSGRSHLHQFGRAESGDLGKLGLIFEPFSRLRKSRMVQKLEWIEMAQLAVSSILFKSFCRVAPITLTILLPRLGQCDQKGSKMIWAQLLAYVTGTVDQELLLRNEYLAAENRILKAQINGRLLLSDAERMTLSEIGRRLGRKALGEVATAALPDTILGWYRRLVARKFDGSCARRAPGRPPIGKDIEELIVRMA